MFYTSFNLASRALILSRKDRDACREMLPDANFIEARLLKIAFTDILGLSVLKF